MTLLAVRFFQRRSEIAGRTEQERSADPQTSHCFNYNRQLREFRNCGLHFQPSNPANAGCNSGFAQYSHTPILHHSERPDSTTSTKRLVRSWVQPTALKRRLLAPVRYFPRLSEIDSFRDDSDLLLAPYGKSKPQKSPFLPWVFFGASLVARR